MVEITVRYDGDLSCAAVHGPSGKEIRTDAPADNHGKGETFSPTDLVAAAAGTCAATIMGIFAERRKIDLRGLAIKVEKHMQSDPRRIGLLVMKVTFPPGIDAQFKSGLEAAARACPVLASLHPEVKAEVVFIYPD